MSSGEGKTSSCPFNHRPSPASRDRFLVSLSRAAYARDLKTRFVPSRGFESNLNYRHLHKMRTIGATRWCARVNEAFTMQHPAQHLVHHSTRRSPCRTNEEPAHAGLARFSAAEQRRAGCLSVRLSGV